MNHTLYIIRAAVGAVLLAIAAAGCQNNGDIGYLFGTWRIDSFTSDGVERPEAAARTLISFQNDIIMVQELEDEHGTYTNHFGTWSEDGDKMTIDFTHSGETAAYSAPAWLGWTSEAPMTMQVSGAGSRDVTWTYVSAEGVTNVYKLHKTW